MPIEDAVRARGTGAEVDVSVSPNSGRSGIEGFDKWRKRIVIKVRSPPLDGKANKEVEEILSEITNSQAVIVKGHTSRQKTVLIEGDPDVIISKLRDRIE